MSRSRKFALLIGGWLSVWAALVHAGSPADRAISIERAIAIADSELGYTAGRPTTVEMITAKYFFTKQQDLLAERIAVDPAKLKALLSGKQFWVIAYRNFPLTLGGGVVVFIDGHTGAVIHVVRGR